MRRCASSTTPAGSSRPARLSSCHRRSASRRSAGTSRTTSWPMRWPRAPPRPAESSGANNVAAYDFSARRGRSHGSTTDSASPPSSSSAPTDALRRRDAPPASPSTPTAIRRARSPCSCRTAPHRRRLDRISHPPGTLHPGAAAAGPGRPDRSSLVWVMSDAEAGRREALDDKALAREIERQARSLLGAMRIEGRRGLFPMAPGRAEADRAAARPRRRRGARLSADRRPGAEPRPARRRGDRRARRRRREADGGDIGGDRRLPPTSGRARRHPDPHRRGRRAQPGAPLPASPRSPSPGAPGLRRSAPSGRSGALSCGRGSRPVSGVPDGDLGRGHRAYPFPSLLGKVARSAGGVWPAAGL